ncbi:alpha/beta hydrolase [Hanstruepera neustonica]|uniref:Alpha/beta hydrolase n=1 Tax=Hanstruepera neustonica TaxID=1445657 RepID=A0A2K1DZL6_9FLAO|nr:alpha/beta hydrolase [Hanstruepera neustonica]PNQ73434.1 alpha/beta hydrolase [Hanstruepera neustonica]
MIIIQKFIGLFINLISLVSRQLAARLGLFLFTKPFKGRINEKQSDFLGTSFREELKVNDISVMTYRWLGQGKTVLLAHGWESNAARWQYLIEPLKKLQYNIVALDAPAHGRSGSKRFNALLYAQFIQQVAKKFNPDIIIGHSVGGMATAFSDVNHDNSKLKKLILIGAPSEFTDVLNRYFKMMGYTKRTQNAIVDLIKKRFKIDSISFSTAKQLAQLNVEGLIIHDEKDAIIPYSDAVLINQSFKNSRLITTSGMGHSMAHESISHHIYEFLEG